MAARRLTAKPADEVAAERAEAARLADAGRDVEALLLDRLGSTWPTVYGTAAQAIAEPAVLRVLLGVPHPGPVPSSVNLEGLRERELGEALGFTERTQPEWDGLLFVARSLGADDGARHACEADLASALGYSTQDTDQRPRWRELLSEVAERRRQLSKAKAELDEALLAGASESPTVIDDATPEGVLALLDAAIDALEADGQPSNARAIQQTRDDIADWNGLPLRSPDAFIARKVEAVASAFDAHLHQAGPLAAQVASLAQLDGAVLLARFRRLAAGTDEIIANPSDSGWSERQHLTMLAAICLALVAKLTADTTGGAF
jgi:hypothetical protein